MFALSDVYPSCLMIVGAKYAIPSVRAGTKGIYTITRDNQSKVHQTAHPDLPVLEDGHDVSPSQVLILGVPSVMSQFRNNERQFILLEELCLFWEIGYAKVHAEGDQAGCDTL